MKEKYFWCTLIAFAVNLAACTSSKNVGTTTRSMAETMITFATGEIDYENPNVGNVNAFGTVEPFERIPVVAIVVRELDSARYLVTPYAHVHSTVLTYKNLRLDPSNQCTQKNKNQPPDEVYITKAPSRVSAVSLSPEKYDSPNGYINIYLPRRARPQPDILWKTLPVKIGYGDGGKMVKIYSTQVSNYLATNPNLYLDDLNNQQLFDDQGRLIGFTKNPTSGNLWIIDELNPATDGDLENLVNFQLNRVTIKDFKSLD